MQPGVATPAAAAPASADATLALVRRRVHAELAPLAGRIDADGHYPAEVLRGLGEDGAFALHLGRYSPAGAMRLDLAIVAMAEIGAACMSSAFCAWCQDALGWYLESSDNAGLRARVQPGIAGGALLGGTGLSNPMKALAGIEGFRLRGQRVAGGYVVSGVLPWVSNLGDGHWFGTVFEDAADPSHRVMTLARCGDPGVEIRQNAHFIALEGTGTYSVLFRRAFLPDEALLADPLGDMARRIRPGFVLLQTGMGFGVIEASIAAMRGADATHLSTNRFLPLRPEALEEEHASLRERVLLLARTPRDLSPEYLRAVLEARLAVSELTLAATQTAMLHGGARGYLDGSDVQRRRREGDFVALITPSVRHLRQELAGPDARQTRN